MEYKKLKEKRKNIRGNIKDTYLDNKDYILDVKEDERRERREKLEKAGIKIIDTASNVKDKITEIGGNIKDKITTIVRDIADDGR